MPATHFGRETHLSVRLSKWENDFSQNASFLFRSGENFLERGAEWVENWLFSKCQLPFAIKKLAQAWGWVTENTNFSKMPGPFFVRKNTYPGVRLGEWENEFSQNASNHFRSKKSLERKPEWVRKWPFLKCQLPFSLREPIRAWDCVSVKITFLKMPAPLFVRKTHPSVRLIGWRNGFSYNASFPFRSGNSFEREAA